MDSAGNPHIVFAIQRACDLDTLCQYLRYAYYNGSIWTVQDVGGPEPEAPPSLLGENFTFYLALDANDNPHVTYYDGSAINHTTSTDNGATWSTPL